jgi:RNA polymerase sigma-70 factor (ECF subfamily)
MTSMDNRQKSEWIREALDAHEGSLVRYACRFTRDLERARDIVQDTFLRLCSQPRSKVEDHLKAWLFTVCRNRALDVLAKERKMNPTSEIDFEVIPAPAPDPAEAAATKEMAGRVLGLVQSLPPRQREAVILKFQENLSYKEIGEVMNTTVSNVGVLLHTALGTLRERLDHQPTMTQRKGGL